MGQVSGDWPPIWITFSTGKVGLRSTSPRPLTTSGPASGGVLRVTGARSSMNEEGPTDKSTPALFAPDDEKANYQVIQTTMWFVTNGITESIGKKVQVEGGQGMKKNIKKTSVTKKNVKQEANF